MIVVSFEKELRAAFAAGQASMLPLLAKNKVEAGSKDFFASVPRTYEEWIASTSDSPTVVLGQPSNPSSNETGL